MRFSDPKYPGYFYSALKTWISTPIQRPMAPTSHVLHREYWSDGVLGVLAEDALRITLMEVDKQHCLLQSQCIPISLTCFFIYHFSLYITRVQSQLRHEILESGAL